MDLEGAVKKGILVRVDVSSDLVEKELVEAAHDLGSCRKAFSEEDYKWSIIQAYYAMFHAAKGVLFSSGLRERSHLGVIVFLESLSERGEIKSLYVNDYKAAVSAREAADYKYTYSRERAEQMVKIAELFISRMKELAKGSSSV